MLSLEALCESYIALYEYVLSDPRLSAFAPAVAELAKQAKALARGERSLPVLAECAAAPHIPTRELAIQLLARVAHIPTADGDESPDLLRALAELSANLYRVLIRDIARNHSDLIPRRPAS